MENQHHSSSARTVLSAMIFFILLLLLGCEAPRVVEDQPDAISGRWDVEIAAHPRDPRTALKFRLMLDYFDGRVSGVMLPMGEKNTFPPTDISGTFSGDEIMMDRWLRPSLLPKDWAMGLHAGKFSGTLAEDASSISGTVRLQEKDVREWKATRM